MGSVILKTILTFLVIYSIIDIFSRLFRFFVLDDKKSETVVVIRVKNQDDNLEYVVRSIMWRFLNKKNGGKMPYILIVDMGSDDDTPKIASRLCEDYGFIYYTTLEKYNEFKNQLTGE